MSRWAGFGFCMKIRGNFFQITTPLWPLFSLSKTDHSSFSGFEPNDVYNFHFRRVLHFLTARDQVRWWYSGIIWAFRSTVDLMIENVEVESVLHIDIREPESDISHDAQVKFNLWYYLYKILPSNPLTSFVRLPSPLTYTRQETLYFCILLR